MSVAAQVWWLRDREDMSGVLIGIEIKRDVESEYTKEMDVATKEAKEKEKETRTEEGTETETETEEGGHT